MPYKRLLPLLMIVVFAGLGCNNPDSTSLSSGEIDRSAILLEAKENGLIMSDDETAMMSDSSMREKDSMAKSVSPSLFVDEDFDGWMNAALADVTGGESFGIAHSVFESGEYKLVVSMGNLPKLENDYFYEGWIVRRGSEFSVVSTGRAEQNEDGSVNAYQSAQNLIDYDFYVLTLEPDDGDPAPAEHILEGTFK